MIMLWAVILLTSAQAGLPDVVRSSARQNSEDPLLNSGSLKDGLAQGMIIKNVEQDTVLDIPWASLPGKDVGLLAVSGADNQVFTLNPACGGTYRLINPKSGLYLQSLPGSDLVHVGSEGTNPSSMWNLEKTGNNAYTIQNAGNLLYMDTIPQSIGAESIFGYSAALKPKNETKSQNWYLSFTM